MNTHEQFDKEYVLSSYKRRYVNFTKGQGSKLWDEDGKEYIDFMSGIAVNSLGYGNDKLQDTICATAGNIMHISNLYYIEPQAKLAKKIKELSGMDIRVFFGNSGAEANEGAIKIARKYGEKNDKKRYKVITVKNSFHGRTITTLKATAQDKFHSFFGPYPEGFIHAGSLDEAMALAEDDNEVVAIMFELVQGEGGVIPFAIEKVKEVETFCRLKDILLIIDEVQTGVFRSGEFLASQVYDITPDIFTLAKGLAGGIPIGAVCTRLKDIFSYGDHGSTFGGNLLSTNAALTVLDELNKLKISGELRNTITEFQAGLDMLVAKFPVLFEKKQGLGLMMGLKMANDDTVAKTVDKAFDGGVLVIKAGNGALRFLPALNIKSSDINEGFARLEKALSF